MSKCTFYDDFHSQLLSNISETYDIDYMSDSELFVLLMGFQDYNSFLSVIKFVKSAFESRVTVDI